jgi:hypothetical protein
MQRYGQLRFIEDAGPNKHGQRLWRLVCDCGKECVKLASAVRIGRTRSCGCLARSGLSNRRHGKRHSQVYNVWCNMKARCSNPQHPAYHNYGGRGIGFAPDWQSFENFLRDVGEPPSPKHTFDRINNDGNYEPGNVRWASRAIQARNTRNTILLSINGRTKCLSDWCDHYGITLSAVHQRMSKGEDLVSAIVRPKADRFQTKPEGTGA